jgi:hypothetical protein
MLYAHRPHFSWLVREMSMLTCDVNMLNPCALFSPLILRFEIAEMTSSPALPYFYLRKSQENTQSYVKFGASLSYSLNYLCVSATLGGVWLQGLKPLQRNRMYSLI